MLAIPDLDRIGVVFGDIKHMPKYDALSKDFQEGRGAAKPYYDAISSWFFNGAKRDGQNLVINGKTFKPRDGVDAEKVLRAIKAILGSLEPKHEHKEAACAFMLSEWFENSMTMPEARETASERAR